MFKLAAIGLDTSHTIAFTELMQDEQKKIVDGLQVVSCMRFPTPFQSEPDQDKRQETLEKLGVRVTRSFEEAVEGVDGILIEINDPSLHLEYFEKASRLSLPIFLDKPLADTLENGQKIYKMAKERKVKVWSSSSLRFTPDIIDCAEKVKHPQVAGVFGALGEAASGNSLVWYGVHTFEMLVTLMGRGAKSVLAHESERGVVSIVEYENDRRGVVECNKGLFKYGGHAIDSDNAVSFVNTGSPYPFLIQSLRNFFLDGEVPVPLEDTLEVQALLEAASKSVESGRKESIELNV